MSRLRCGSIDTNNTRFLCTWVKIEASAAAEVGTSELATQLGVSPELAASMVAAGFTTAQGIAAYVQPEDLVEALQITEEEATAIIEKAKAAC